MVDRHAVEFPQKQEVRVFHMTNSSDLADTRCSSSAGVDETVVARARNFVPELRCRSRGRNEWQNLGQTMPRDRERVSPVTQCGLAFR